MNFIVFFVFFFLLLSTNNILNAVYFFLCSTFSNLLCKNLNYWEQSNTRSEKVQVVSIVLINKWFCSWVNHCWKPFFYLHSVLYLSCSSFRRYQCRKKTCKKEYFIFRSMHINDGVCSSIEHSTNVIFSTTNFIYVLAKELSHQSPSFK